MGLILCASPLTPQHSKSIQIPLSKRRFTYLTCPTIYRFIYRNKSKDNGYIHMVRIINLGKDNSGIPSPICVTQ